MLIPFLLVKGANELPREYASGADIVMQDAYPVGINATWSIVWDTPCTVDFGDCGYVDLTYKRCLLSHMRQVATTVKGPSKIFLPGWMNSVNVFLSTDGNAPRHFGLYPKHLDNHRKVRMIGHIPLTDKLVGL